MGVKPKVSDVAGRKLAIVERADKAAASVGSRNCCDIREIPKPEIANDSNRPEAASGYRQSWHLLKKARHASFSSRCRAYNSEPPDCPSDLQVAAGVYSGVIWCLENRFAGVVEPEDIDHKRILEIALPYLGRLEMFETAWMPDNGVDELFDRSRLPTDAQWQIENFIV